MLDYLARQSPSRYDQMRLIDATPVPCGTSRETVKRSELAGWADYGYGAAHSRWCWGLKLYVITTPDGMPVAWYLASPKIGEREVAAGLLAHAARTGALRPGLILIGGKGFAGSSWQEIETLPQPLRRTVQGVIFHLLDEPTPALADPFPGDDPLPGAYELHLPSDSVTIWYTVTSYEGRRSSASST